MSWHGLAVRAGDSCPVQLRALCGHSPATCAVGVSFSVLLVLAALRRPLQRWRSAHRTTRIIGIDLGAATIKVAVLAHRSGAQPLLERFFVAPAPEGAVARGVVRDRAAVARALSELWTTAGLPVDATVVASIGGDDVVVERLSIEPGTPTEIEAQVHARAVSEIPFEPEESLYTFSVLRLPAKAQMIPTLLIGLRHAPVQAMHETFRHTGGGMAVACLDVHAAALYNVLRHSVPTMRGPALHLHIGASLVTALILDDQADLLAARDLSAGLAGHTAGIGASAGNGLDAWAQDLRTQVPLLWKKTGLNGLQRPLYVSGGGSLSEAVLRTAAEALQCSGAERLTLFPAVELAPEALPAGMSQADVGAIGFHAVGLALRDDAMRQPVSPSRRRRA